MAAEWRNKAENPVEYGRPSVRTIGGIKARPDYRMRQPHKAKEPLCGTQPANLSLVIAVLRFPPCSVIFAVETLNAIRRPIYKTKNF
jgi:hypothetical protein